MNKKFVAGVDFGTSNSAIGIGSTREDICLVNLELNKKVIPTTIFFRNSNVHSVDFGSVAVNRYLNAESGRFMRCLKSLLGCSVIGEGTCIGTDYVRFDDIISYFISHMKDKAEKEVGQSLTDIIVGRPVHFSDIEKEDKKAQTTLYEICKNLGFKNIGFQYEPIAAALDYEKQITEEQLVFVADIGGGTSDFTVIKLSPKNKLKSDRTQDILSNDSIHIAGTDLDYKVNFMKVMPSFGKNTHTKDGLPIPMTYFTDLSKWERIVRLYNPEVIASVKNLEQYAEKPELLKRYVHILEKQIAHNICFATEQAKIDLSTSQWTEIDLYETVDELEIPITKEEFEETVNYEVSSICKKAKETINQAGVNPDHIDTILFTGGTSKVPTIKDGIISLCPKAIVHKLDSFAAVASGLTLDAVRRFGRERE